MQFYDEIQKIRGKRRLITKAIDIAEYYKPFAPNRTQDIVQRGIDLGRDYAGSFRKKQDRFLAFIHAIDGYQPNNIYMLCEDMSGAPRDIIVKSMAYGLFRSIFQSDARQALVDVHCIGLDLSYMSGLLYHEDVQRHERIIKGDA